MNTTSSAAPARAAAQRAGRRRDQAEPRLRGDPRPDDVQPAARQADQRSGAIDEHPRLITELIQQGRGPIELSPRHVFGGDIEHSRHKHKRQKNVLPPPAATVRQRQKDQEQKRPDARVGIELLRGKSPAGIGPMMIGRHVVEPDLGQAVRSDQLRVRNLAVAIPVIHHRQPLDRRQSHRQQDDDNDNGERLAVPTRPAAAPIHLQRADDGDQRHHKDHVEGVVDVAGEKKERHGSGRGQRMTSLPGAHCQQRQCQHPGNPGETEHEIVLALKKARHPLAGEGIHQSHPKARGPFQLQHGAQLPHAQRGGQKREVQRNLEPCPYAEEQDGHRRQRIVDVQEGIRDVGNAGAQVRVPQRELAEAIQAVDQRPIQRLKDIRLVAGQDARIIEVEKGGAEGQDKHGQDGPIYEDLARRQHQAIAWPGRSEPSRAQAPQRGRRNARR